MSDLRKQIREHYDAKSLPAERVEAILARGRAVVGEEPGAVGEKVVRFPARVRRAGLALAAGVALCAGLAIWWPRADEPPVAFAALAPRIVEFFGQPPELPKRSQNPEELRAWLVAQGAPADYQVPSKLRGLETLGCQVVDVRGRPAYLMCFWTQKPAPGSDGQLVHLWVAHRRDFRDGPAAAPQFREEGGWSFAAWSEGEAIYTLAAAAPLEQLRTFVALRMKAVRLLAGVRADRTVNS